MAQQQTQSTKPVRYMDSSPRALGHSLNATLALDGHGLLWDGEGNAVSGHTFIHHDHRGAHAHQLSKDEWDRLGRQLVDLISSDAIWDQPTKNNRFTLPDGVKDPLDVTFNELERTHVKWKPISQKREETLKPWRW